MTDAIDRPEEAAMTTNAGLVASDERLAELAALCSAGAYLGADDRTDIAAAFRALIAARELAAQYATGGSAVAMSISRQLTAILGPALDATGRDGVGGNSGR